MNAYLAKQDLEKYSTADLLTLAKHYNITVEDRDELCWLLGLCILSEHQTMRGTMNGVAEPNVDNLLQWAREIGVENKIRQALHPRANSLDLKSIGLTELPTEISELGNIKNLEILELDDNNLTNLPKEIGYLTNLVVLSLSGNELTELPPEIGNLTNLEILRLQNNQLEKLPVEFNNLVSLEELHLGYNKLQDLPNISNFTKLIELDLSGLQLTELPPGVSNLPDLQNLYISDNELTILPAELGALDLGDLDVDDNPLLENTPKTIQELQEQWTTFPKPTAKRVHMNGAKVDNLLQWARENGIENKIKAVLDGSDNLSLRGMNLTMLPEEIGELNLRSLDLRDNNLTELPVSIGDIKNLQLLFLQNNQLEDIPAEIGNLEKLFGLDLTGNPLKGLPIELVQLPHLNKIKVDDGVFAEHMTDELNSLLEVIPAGDPNWKQNRENILRQVPNSSDKNIADAALIYYVETGQVPVGDYPTGKTAR